MGRSAKTLNTFKNKNDVAYGHKNEVRDNEVQSAVLTRGNLIISWLYTETERN